MNFYLKMNPYIYVGDGNTLIHKKMGHNRITNILEQVLIQRDRGHCKYSSLEESHNEFSFLFHFAVRKFFVKLEGQV